MNKRKSLAKRILSVLEKDSRREYNAPTIDRIICGEKNYVKKHREAETHKIRTELRRMVKRGMIRSDKKGFYSLIITARNIHLLENPPTVVHGLKIELRLKEAPTANLMGGVSSTRNKYLKKKTDDELLDWLVVSGFVETSNNRFHRRFNWEGRWVTLTVHPLNGLIEVWVQSSLCPLLYTDLVRLREYLKGMLLDVTDFTGAMVRQVGINKDFRELRLDGVSSLSLHTFINAWSRVYYKESLGAVRVETHWTGTISFEEAILLVAKVNAPPEKKRDESEMDDSEVMFG